MSFTKSCLNYLFIRPVRKGARKCSIKPDRSRSRRYSTEHLPPSKARTQFTRNSNYGVHRRRLDSSSSVTSSPAPSCRYPSPYSTPFIFLLLRHHSCVRLRRNALHPGVDALMQSGTKVSRQQPEVQGDSRTVSGHLPTFALRNSWPRYDSRVFFSLLFPLSRAHWNRFKPFERYHDRVTIGFFEKFLTTLSQLLLLSCSGDLVTRRQDRFDDILVNIDEYQFRTLHRGTKQISKEIVIGIGKMFFIINIARSIDTIEIVKQLLVKIRMQLVQLSRLQNIRII